MTAYVGLLRGVNVGPHNRVPMVDLKRMGEAAGFAKVRTFIASGNLVFESRKSEAAAKAALEKQLKAFAGKPIQVFVRTAKEMAAIVADFPFADEAGNRAMVIFLDATPMGDVMEGISGQDGERVATGKREIYVAYGNGISQSKLKIPSAAKGTMRNMNSVAKLADMAAAI